MAGIVRAIPALYSLWFFGMVREACVHRPLDVLGLSTKWTRNTLWLSSGITGLLIAFVAARATRYQEDQRQAAERSKRGFAELQKQLHEREERRFIEEVLYQALRSPHFVATNHTHQDR